MKIDLILPLCFDDKYFMRFLIAKIYDVYTDMSETMRNEWSFGKRIDREIERHFLEYIDKSIKSTDVYCGFVENIEDDYDSIYLARRYSTINKAMKNLEGLVKIFNKMFNIDEEERFEIHFNGIYENVSHLSDIYKPILPYNIELYNN